MRSVIVASIIKAWSMAIDEILFPPEAVRLLTPDMILRAHAGNLVELRKINKDRVDAIIAEVRSADGAAESVQVLLKSEPLAVALYYERLLRSKAHLLKLQEDHPHTQVPAQIDELIDLLLFHERVQ